MSTEIRKLLKGLSSQADYLSTFYDAKGQRLPRTITSIVLHAEAVERLLRIIKYLRDHYQEPIGEPKGRADDE